ncbi:CYTH domain-containing protein [Flavobacteriaceae bacterium S356]|uniref:CYTH domain-containing protein n=1 Tax=Asprobacillus argus TaxID=3076534 RepID=A0ABU3LBP1_9FLAO|nr:CYTH domain-containing protein [Flavobacteriaceae bacterium S356]
MELEIERKFLVRDTSFKKEAYKRSHIRQGFLNSDKHRVVRVRLIDDKGYLTIKGISNDSGTSRLEWEKEIDAKEAISLLQLSENGVIEKYRHYVRNEHLVFEVDEFLGENIGLLIAEIEVSNEKETFKKPSWLGEEVTGIEKYYNSNLYKNPFNNWA